MGKELKPCPFCGSSNVAQGASQERISVWCFCGARGPDVAFPETCIEPAKPIRECHDLWNRRALPTVTPAEAGGLVDTLRSMSQDDNTRACVSVNVTVSNELAKRLFDVLHAAPKAAAALEAQAEELAATQEKLIKANGELIQRRSEAIDSTGTVKRRDIVHQIALWSDDEGLDLSMGQGDDLASRILSALKAAMEAGR